MAHKLQYYSHNNLLCSPWLFIHLFKIECEKLQMKIIISILKHFFFQRVEYYLKDKHISRNNIQSAAHIMRHSFSDK